MLHRYYWKRTSTGITLDSAEDKCGTCGDLWPVIFCMFMVIQVQEESKDPVHNDGTKTEGLQIAGENFDNNLVHKEDSRIITVMREEEEGFISHIEINSSSRTTLEELTLDGASRSYNPVSVYSDHIDISKSRKKARVQFP